MEAKGFEDYVWRIAAEPNVMKWDVTQGFLQRSPLASVYIFFGTRGYLTYYDVIALDAPMIVHASTLKPIPSEGLFLPWEVFDGPAPASRVATYEYIWNARDSVSIEPNAPPISTTHALGRQLEVYCNYLWFLKTGAHPARLPPSDLGKRDWTRLHQMTEDDVINALMESAEYRVQLENGTLWTDPEPEDIRAFMGRHRVSLADGPKVFPSIIFVIPFEEYPIGAIFRGGVTRLSFRDVPYWLHAKEQRIEQHELPKRAYVELYEECQGDFSRVMGGRLEDIWRKLPAPIPPASQETRAMHGRSTVPGTGGNIADIEDLIERSPPCIKKLLKQKRWYKDGERVQLTHQLKAGGVTQDLVKKVFKRAADFARDGDGTWDYKYAWKTTINYAQSCVSIIRNATENRPYTIQCPFANGKQQPQIACIDKLQERFPEKREKITVLRSPSEWY
jgi:hypothetical protein